MDLATLARVFVEPNATVTEVEARQQGRFLATFYMTVAPLSLVTLGIQAQVRPEFAPAVQVLMPGYAFMVLPYALARTRHYRVGIWLTMALITVMSAVVIVYDPGNETPYAYLLVPAMVASVLMRLRYALLVGLANLLTGAALAANDPTLEAEKALTTVVMLLVMSMVIGVAARHRSAIEAARSAEMAIRDRRQSALLEAAFGGMALIHEGEILDCSRGFAAIFGYASPEIVGQRLEQFLAPTEREAIGEREALHRDGHIFPVEVVAFPYEEAGEQRSAVAVRDLSEHRRLRAQLHQADRMATMGQLAAGVAHEINNPLAWVVGNLEVLRERLKGEDRDIAKRAVEGAQRVERIVRDLKTFSRTRPPEPSAVDLARAVGSAVNMVRHQVRDRAVLIEDYTPVPTVDGDETRIGQVCLNLLVNALEALPPDKHDTNRIEVRLYTDDHGEAVIEVKDNGPGIPAEVRHRMFEPFFTTKQQGTGLGLSITRSITASLGGRLVVDSRTGVGTKMKVVLPAGSISLPTAAPISLDTGPGANRDGIYRVLVVDDESDILALMGTALRGYEVTTASCASDALELLEVGHYDGILCDLMMPEKTGMELHDEAMARWPGLAGRFAFMTGGAYTEEARLFLDQTAARVLHKPFQLKELRGIVEELVETTAA